MTGRELIMYILQNKLEDAPVIQNGVFIWLMTEEEAAAKFEVGVATIRAWYLYGKLDGIKFNGQLYFLRNIEDPRKKDESND
jgi:hypothetical protein